MAKKSGKTYQIVIQNSEDQAFIKRLLEIYGYQEGEPGIFSETPISKTKPKTGSSKSAVATELKAAQEPASSKPNTSKKPTAVKAKKITIKAAPVKSSKAITKAPTPTKATKTGKAGAKITQSAKPKKRS